VAMAMKFETKGL